MIEKKRIININDLFSDEDNILESSDSGIKEIYLYKLVPFRNHPFKLYEGQRLEDMVESIKEHGVITPIIVRPLPIQEEQYEILSGHNRANAAKIVGLEKIPAVIKEGLTDEEAMLIVTETNLIQRSFSELSHSEKARIIAERHKAIKQQGKRTDLINEVEMLSNTDGCAENPTFVQFDKKMKSNEKLGEKYDLSPATISRYLKIDMLIDKLKTRLDNKEEIPLMAAVNLSFLKVDEQEIIEGILKEKNFKIDIKKAEILKSFSKGRNFNYDKAYEVLSGKYFNKPKKSQKPKFTPRFTKDIVEKYVTDEVSIKDIENIIEDYLKEYFSKERSETI